MTQTLQTKADVNSYLRSRVDGVTPHVSDMWLPLAVADDVNASLFDYDECHRYLTSFDGRMMSSLGGYATASRGAGGGGSGVFDLDMDLEEGIGLSFAPSTAMSFDETEVFLGGGTTAADTPTSLEDDDDFAEFDLFLTDVLQEMVSGGCTSLSSSLSSTSSRRTSIASTGGVVYEMRPTTSRMAEADVDVDDRAKLAVLDYNNGVDAGRNGDRRWEVDNRTLGPPGNRITGPGVNQEMIRAGGSERSGGGGDSDDLTYDDRYWTAVRGAPTSRSCSNDPSTSKHTPYVRTSQTYLVLLVRCYFLSFCV